MKDNLFYSLALWGNISLALISWFAIYAMKIIPFSWVDPMSYAPVVYLFGGWLFYRIPDSIPNENGNGSILEHLLLGLFILWNSYLLFLITRGFFQFSVSVENGWFWSLCFFVGIVNIGTALALLNAKRILY